MSDLKLDELCVNTLRFLAVDAVEKAKSGHPGMPMGAAVIAYVLWDRFLKHNPADPTWHDRDRFVLSAGHASAMLYSLLHLTGYDLSLEEIKQFRQWGSKTPGHPEHGLTPGVEATTGPLGQGFGNGVGMAIAERWLAEHYNKPGHKVINHYTYGLVSDGDMEEGVSSEAASLAGTLRLGKLIYIYDCNGVSIEGKTDVTFTENVGQRFQAYGWRVIGPVDGLNIEAVDKALWDAQLESIRPTLIICKTIIGYGSPNKADTGAAHGEPLGQEEVRLAKERLGWRYQAPFTIPTEALAHYRMAVQRGKFQQQVWEVTMEAYHKAYPAEASQLERDLKGALPPDWDSEMDGLFKDMSKPVSTRDASGKVMNVITKKVHSFAGGAADLSPSTKTILIDKGDFKYNSYDGHNFHFGVREHSMGTICTGMALHKGMIPFAATFLIFYDYMRPPVRLAALMKLRVIFVFTHDSVALGQDGPTHQPVEHLMGMRAVPNLVTIRPADATETAEAWRIAMERTEGPTALILTRQGVPVLDRSSLAAAEGVGHGGYVLWEAGPPDVILIGTGSEVHVALQAGKMLKDRGVSARVVSLPSWVLFDREPPEYKEKVLPRNIRARVSIEAGSTVGWERYVGLDGVAIGVSRFGASAPGEEIYSELGLTAERVVEAATSLLNKK